MQPIKQTTLENLLSLHTHLKTSKIALSKEFKASLSKKGLEDCEKALTRLRFFAQNDADSGLPLEVLAKDCKECGFVEERLSSNRVALGVFKPKVVSYNEKDFDCFGKQCSHKFDCGITLFLTDASASGNMNDLEKLLAEKKQAIEKSLEKLVLSLVDSHIEEKTKEESK